MTKSAAIIQVDPPHKEYIGIQYLRGIAAILVVAYHLEPQITRMGYRGNWLPGLGAGVDLFFVISGFIMWVTTSKGSTTTFQFWTKRILRIAPLYWVFTTVMVCVMIFAPKILQSSAFELRHISMSYVFLPSIHPIKGTLEPAVIPGWTLNYEMFFYLIFGLFLQVRPSVKFLGTAGIIIGLVFVGTIYNFPRNSIYSFYTSSILLEFMFGVSIGVLITHSNNLKKIGYVAGWWIFCISASALCFLPDIEGIDRLFNRGIPAALVVLGTLAIEDAKQVVDVTWLHRLGNASYSIYLSQLFTMSAYSQLWRKLNLDHMPGGIALFCATALPITIIAGCFCYSLIETKLQAAILVLVTKKQLGIS